MKRDNDRQTAIILSIVGIVPVIWLALLISVFIPFRVQDIFHENGIYYGQNVISKNMIIADRKQLLNGNSFILGVSGGGKSFAAKGEIINQVLSSDADIIIIDPEREYSQLVNAMGGEVINISATSDNHINAMDMNKDYGDGANPVILKSEFIMSLCEQLIGGTNLGAKQKSIIDRCTASVYRSYQQNDYQGHIPTLQDFRAELLQQDEPEAKELALASYRKVCTAVGRQVAQSRSATLPLISGMDLRKKAGKISIHRRNCSVADMLRILWRVSS